MNDWEHLMNQAILGTGRQPFSLPEKSVLAPFWPQLQAKAPAQQLLDCAALLVQYQQVGWQLPLLENPTFEPSPPETQPPCSAKATEYLQRLLQEEYSEVQTALLIEWLRLLQSAGQRIPFEMLPILLEKGQKGDPLRPYLKNTIGQRGYWLVQLNPDWQYFNREQQEVTELWQTGPKAARLAYLQQCRETDPTQAKILLAQTWSQEIAQDRQAFLTTFWTHLSLEDESFLEQCVDDRSLNIRQLAAQMLGSLEHSRLLKQVLGYLSAFIQVKKGRTKATLEIHLPSEYNKNWTPLGIKEKPPAYPKMGEKIGWLYQMLLLIRPSFWLAALDLSAETYSKLLRKTEFAEVLSHALLTATQKHRDSTVAIALIRQGQAKKFLGHLIQLVEALSIEEREMLWQEYIKTYQTVFSWSQLQSLLKLFPNGLSVALSQTLLNQTIPQLFNKSERYTYYQEVLNLLATTLASECYPAAQKLSIEEPAALEHFMRIYELRYQMKKELMS